MAKYYINGANKSSNGVFPYDTMFKGAKNFFSLIMDNDTRVDLMDGDEILLLNPVKDETNAAGIEQYSIDDSTNDIEIGTRVVIKPVYNDADHVKPKVKLQDDGDGIIITNTDYANGTYIERINFHTDTVSAGSRIKVDGCSDITIKKCKFTYDNITLNEVGAIYVTSSNYVNIEDNEIFVAGDTMAVGVFIENSNKCNVYRNIFNLSEVPANVILLSASSVKYGNKVKENLIYNSNVETSNIGILCIGAYNNTEVIKNVIAMDGLSATGIRFDLDSGFGLNTEIRNNLIIIEDGNNFNKGIDVIYDSPATLTEYNIINNNIINTDIVTSAVDGISLDIDNGAVNYNNIYNIDEDSRVVFGTSGSLTLFGTYNVSVDPRVLTLIDSVEYISSVYESYYSSADAYCLGIGQYYENIGIGVGEEEYLSFVDTVNHEIGQITVSNSKNVQITFLANTFTESIEDINQMYSKVYVSGDTFENQFSWWSASADYFPFTSGTDLYDKDLVYVIKNKNMLQPFSNISCPANPGYGFSIYKDYETGLFGFSRGTYENTCIEDPCIIQDDYHIDIIWVDTINEGTIIQDAINPPCLSGGI